MVWGLVHLCCLYIEDETLEKLGELSVEGEKKRERHGCGGSLVMAVLCGSACEHREEGRV